MAPDGTSSLSGSHPTADQRGRGWQQRFSLKAWKTELQKLADETGLRIVVAHFPLGTSEWNKSELRNPALRSITPTRLMEF